MTSAKVKEIYREIQKKIFYIIPEKWSKVYLYFAILERPNNLETGELYFYYFPKGVLKKKAINVYEIPARFNIDENEYLKYVNELFKVLKLLRMQVLKENNKLCNNIIVLIENFRFTVEYNYDEYFNSTYSSYAKHQIFRYKYLKTPISSFNKKDKKIIENYLLIISNYKPDVEIYYEPMYNAPFKTITSNSKESNIQYVKEDSIESNKIEEKIEIKNQILKAKL